MTAGEDPSRESGRTAEGLCILHVDMDAFFASVEIRDDPSLRGRPVVVGGDGPRGVVAAASYEARSYGVFSAQPMTVARRRCPHAIVLPARHDHYRGASDAVMDIFGDITPVVEPLSLDEAFLDVRGRLRSLGPAEEIAHLIRRRVREATGLTCSVGVAPNKFLAKLATGAAKPSASRAGPVPGLGVKVLAAEEVRGFLHPLPVGALWGVGPATKERLEAIGVQRVGELSALPVDVVVAALGEGVGRHLWHLSHGRDDRAVCSDAKAKSISHEETFAVDVADVDHLRREVLRLADSVAYRLRRAGLVARTVTLKLRSPDFVTVTRSRTLEGPTDDGLAIAAVARDLLSREQIASGVRLIGVAAGGLDREGAEPLQLSLLDDVRGDTENADDPDRRRVVNETVDDIRERFGVTSIGTASLAAPGRPLRDVSDPDRNWGPASDGRTHSRPGSADERGAGG